MKLKHFLSVGILLCMTSLSWTEATKTPSHISVKIDDNIYEVLESAEIRGLCSTLSSVKPYTESYIVSKLNEIEENLQQKEQNWVTEQELKSIQDCKQRFLNSSQGLNLKDLEYGISGGKENFPVSFNIGIGLEGFLSGGIYSNSKNNSVGYELGGNLGINGDIGKNLSYKFDLAVMLTKMELEQLGTYNIGYWWYDNNYESGDTRKINTFRNYSVLPYSYKKRWDGSIYYVSNMSASGLKGWPMELAGGFGMQAELRGSWHDGMVEIGLGRTDREWAAMDEGSSLVLNAAAHPFFAFDATVNLFPWLSVSTLTGFLEFPNQGYITQDAWYISDGNGKKATGTGDTGNVDDSYFFHNLYSIGMLNLNFKYVNLDFGTAVVYPNRFELGYAFPLLDRLLYQNNVGDFDNISLFGDLKIKYPGIGYIWGSLYLDEINSFSAKFFEATRCMFAYQAGVKSEFPWLPFGNISFRYTKIEPYCYTHQALRSTGSQPYFNGYLAESYTNNGASLGYYLPPNSDEFLIKFTTQPFSGANISFQYQLIRHGVDWGSEANMDSGSSIYSELPTGHKRAEMQKYFLHDGTYEWTNILALSGSYDFKKHGVPILAYGTIGFTNNWFTSINGQTPSRNTSFSRINTDEYKEGFGTVVSVGIKAFSY